MKTSSLVMFLLVGLPGLAGSSADADSYYGTPRQYYSDYTYVPSYGYGYRKYYFKPTQNYAGYDYHYVIYPQSDPHHAYYYNPHTQNYWGRCPSHCHGEAYYSVLPRGFQKSSLAEIPATAFPQPGPLPSIPGTKDNTILDLAPDDTPVAPVPVAAPAAAPPVGAAPAIAIPAGIPTAAAAPPDAPPAAAAIPAPVAQ